MRNPDAGPAVIVKGAPVAWSSLRPALTEAAGGLVLSELVLDRQIAFRLAQRAARVSDADIAAELDILRQSLSTDPDQAQRLLNELRDRRGWGQTRFDSMLRRNAGLRLLVRDQVRVTDDLLKQAFDYRHGPRYEVRLIAVETLVQASEVVRRARQGESFADLAVALSTDASRAQGGLLSPLSLVDPSYPPALRAAVAGLSPGQVADPVAMDRGYAVLRLERKIDAQTVKFDDVKNDLTLMVERREQRQMMQRLAREMLSEAEVTVLDPALRRGWELQKRQWMSEP